MSFRVSFVLVFFSPFSIVITLLREERSPASILRKSTSGRHRPVSYPNGPMTARYRFTQNADWGANLSAFRTFVRFVLV